LAVAAAEIAAREKQGDGLARVLNDDDRTAVAAGAEGFVAGAFDFDLIVEPEVAKVVADHDVVEFEGGHPAAGKAGSAAELGDFGSFIDEGRPQASQLAESLNGPQV